MTAVLSPSRPKLSWSDLNGARVGVWGLGREGLASIRKLATMGLEPVLVDDRPSSVAIGGLPVLTTGYGGLAALEKCDVVVKSPGISRYRPEVAKLEERGVPVAGGLGLWLQETDPRRVLLITGTKGKSTTASIAGHLLGGLAGRTMIGGNIGLPPYDPEAVPADGQAPWEYWVIEVSSYQATDLCRSTPVVAVTSLHPDHLDWHGGVDQYYRDKLSICSLPGADLTVANGDSDLIRAREALLGPRVEWVHEADDPDATWMAPLGLIGGHSRRNALIARRALQAMGIAGAADDEALRAAAEGFVPLDHRLQVTDVIDGVTFVDDSLSTNVLPTLAALDAFPGRRVALIVGGHDRGIDYAPLAVGLRQRSAPTLVLTLPDSGPRIHQEIEAALAAAPAATPSAVTEATPAQATPAQSTRAPATPAPAASAAPPTVAGVHDCPDLDAAVTRAFDWARPDGVVLLSPAAPSFGHFRDYRDRADAFSRAVAHLTTAP
ncbi:MAG: UDP-N-acetylmuramoyl-L-alanine--D-glutamate ligase [Actinobacteria bacterium]|nr:UDP-N-acetylmuramoyl-L-alanine--D-glutamate ligase [Actinomycetota bacterium]